MKDVINFLTGLSANNNRDWFEAHKAEYRTALKEFNAFVAELISGIASFDASVSGLEVKDCTYRIYRDVRFSKNKLPYKTGMGAYICAGGKKSGKAGYYFHVEPGNGGMIGSHMLSSGIYMPEPTVLNSIREEIMLNGEGFLADAFKAKGFILDTDNLLKRVPSGFPADSPYAEYFKLKDVYLHRYVDNDFMLSPGLLERSVEAFSSTRDFVGRLNRAVDYARNDV